MARFVPADLPPPEEFHPSAPTGVIFQPHMSAPVRRQPSGLVEALGQFASTFEELSDRAIERSRKEREDAAIAEAKADVARGQEFPDLSGTSPTYHRLRGSLEGAKLGQQALEAIESELVGDAGRYKTESELEQLFQTKVNEVVGEHAYKDDDFFVAGLDEVVRPQLTSIRQRVREANQKISLNGTNESLFLTTTQALDARALQGDEAFSNLWSAVSANAEAMIVAGHPAEQANAAMASAVLAKAAELRDEKLLDLLERPTARGRVIASTPEIVNAINQTRDAIRQDIEQDASRAYSQRQRQREQAADALHLEAVDQLIKDGELDPAMIRRLEALRPGSSSTLKAVQGNIASTKRDELKLAQLYIRSTDPNNLPTGEELLSAVLAGEITATQVQTIRDNTVSALRNQDFLGSPEWRQLDGMFRSTLSSVSTAIVPSALPGGQTVRKDVMTPLERQSAQAAYVTQVLQLQDDPEFNKKPPRERYSIYSQLQRDLLAPFEAKKKELEKQSSGSVAPAGETKAPPPQTDAGAQSPKRFDAVALAAPALLENGQITDELRTLFPGIEDPYEMKQAIILELSKEVGDGQ